MLATLRPPQITRCPRCQGPLYRDDDGDAGCLFCGECVYASPPPSPRPQTETPTPGAPRKRGRPRKVPLVA